MSQNSFNLKLVGYSEAEKGTISSILFLAQRSLSNTWNIVDTPPIDFYILPSDLIQKLDLDATLKSLPKDRLIFSVSEGEALTQPYPHFLVDTRKVPRLRSLVNTLNELSGLNLDTRQQSEQAAKSVTRDHASSSSGPLAATQTDVFDPKQGFLGKLIECAHAKGLFVFEFKIFNVPNLLYVDPEKQVFYGEGELPDFRPLFNTESSDFSCNILGGFDEGQFNDLIASKGLKAHRLTSLIWYGVYELSHGKLLQGCSPNDVVRLKRWPDLNMPDYKSLLKIAAFMQSNAVNLNTIAERTALPVNLVYNFYNACEIVGLIEHNSITDIYSKQINPDRIELLARIRNRLDHN